jgi:uncharacterized protein
MLTVHEFPHRIHDVEHFWIPMPDGCRLAARMWRPESAERTPVPAIVEYLPYRKRDGTRERDEAMHRYFAGHGYAAIRIDLRGAGESDGVLLDEYLDQELDDGVAAIDWIASQRWCDGAVGMIGKSWGGFNALQIAARRPPALKAVISVCAADDRYADDAHYMGGCLLAENLIWGSALFMLNAQPPDPAIVGARWRTMWLERLERNRLFPALWLEHQHRDEYWRHGSIRENYAAVGCPVYAIGGWADGYSNAVPRLLAGLDVPRRGLVGPWGHVYPHEGRPGPAIGFLQEALRWWERWLKGASSVLDDAPQYRVWMPEHTPERVDRNVAGRWVREREWPSRALEPRTWYLCTDGLRDRPGRERRAEVCSPQSTGKHAGSWCAFGFEGELPEEQSAEDANSLCFDSTPLAERLEILGCPRVELTVAADRPVAMIAVRLNEVTPDGRSYRVSYGLLNLTHRESHSQPTPLVPGQDYRVRIALNDVAYAFKPGHRIRVGVSSAYWPVAWPMPRPVRLSVLCGRGRLELPIRRPSDADAQLRAFAPPEAAYTDPQIELEAPDALRTMTYDPDNGSARLDTRLDLTETGAVALSQIEPIDLIVGSGMHESFEILDSDPLSAHGEIHQRSQYRRGAWEVAVSSDVRMRATESEFVIEASLSAHEGATLAFERRWRETIPRKLV